MPRPFHLYKYASAKVAKIILTTGCLRHSSPVLFNDPFDCYFAPSFSSVTRASQEFGRRRAEIWTGTTARPDQVTKSSPLTQLVDGAPPELVARVKASASAKLLAIARNTNVRWQLWWETMVPRLRVLCFCEEVSNPLLWSHYADFHRGVAFEFDASVRAELIFRSMEPVKYRKRPPRIYSRRDLLESALNVTHLPDLADRAVALVMTKAEQWDYEREWRTVFVEENVDPKKLFSDRPFQPASLSRIFLGCHISPRNRESIKRLVSGPFSHVEVFEAYKTPTHFGLAFRRLRQPVQSEVQSAI